MGRGRGSVAIILTLGCFEEDQGSGVGRSDFPIR